MDPKSLAGLFRGSYSFFQVDLEELRRIVPDYQKLLPLPQRIFLEPEEATPLEGFPVLISPETLALRDALEAFIEAEEQAQIALFRREPIDKRPYEAAWQRYQTLLVQTTENTIRSSFGRHYPGIFWLYHSIAVSRVFKEVPRRIVRENLNIGREYGDAIKYRVFERYLDRILNLTHDVAFHVAQEAKENEVDLFPDILTRMRDNVLILTEDHIGQDLVELDSFFRGYLQLDGKMFRHRLATLHEWHVKQLSEDSDLRSAVAHLIGFQPDGDPRQYINRPGYLRFLAQRPSYNAKTMFSPELVQVWEGLLTKLKEFEVLLALRRHIIPVQKEGEGLVCQAPNPRGSGLLPRKVTLSYSTRPLEFMTPWVVDPLVERFGLIYDITDFSAIISMMKRSGAKAQDNSFRSIFRFQRWVNQLARRNRLKMEKYLGDGALYSGRHPESLLTVSVLLQRYYRRAVEEGFPFDRGMRIALNYGQYRLLPIETGPTGGGQRYEFFGHGIVELTRLVTGKSTHEIDEFRNLLLTSGYSVGEVDRFFGPLMGQNVDLIEKSEQERGFYSYINHNGSLVNEGIVATREFILQLDNSGLVGFLRRAKQGGRNFIVFQLEEGEDQLQIGFRKLGMARLKGLGRQAVYEVVDGERWRDAELPRMPERTLFEALEHRRAASVDSGASAEAELGQA